MGRSRKNTNNVILSNGCKGHRFRQNIRRASVFSDPVADPRFCQDNARVVGVFFDFLPKLADIDAKILRIFGMRRPPNGRQNLLMGDDPAGMPREKREQLEFLRRQLEFGSCACCAWRTASTSRLPTRSSGISAFRCMRWRKAVRIRAKSSPILNGLLT